MDIRVDNTPNPETLKFLAGRPIAPDEPLAFSTPEEATRVPLVQALFDVPGVVSVFLGADFISITKDVKQAWSGLRPQILTVLKDFFAKGLEVLAKAPPTNPESSSPAPDSLEKDIQDLLNERIRPFVAQDGGDIVFKKFEDGVVYLEMRGACSGCPSAEATLKQGVENLLRHYIPEVVRVEPV
ncbi:NifU family protein [Candidatus Hepatobacter penaei]|uniref:NifU family protein n=1 Tax=Candidatus Hepatobacter penaei TaxID=1274402 RepID=UPI0004F2A079|nr:NifU family protein [Candidatus Hepatobacter penaei]